MNISFHTGKSAMIAQSKALNIYGNNIANVNTVGYQTLRPSFADCIYDVQRAPQPDWQTGHGTYIQKTDLMFSESHFNYTERPQDFAIAGEGFFAVQDRWGDVNYTRDGAFAITQLDGVWYLVSSSGEYVLDYDRNRIVVPFQEYTKGDVRNGIDWNAISQQIGTFTLDNVDAQGIRYTYTGSGEVVDENGEVTADPAPVENAVKQMTNADETVPSYAVISSADGYFAVRDRVGNISYTRDGQLSIQKYEGKWYLGAETGEFILDANMKMIPVEFNAPTVDDVNVEALLANMQANEEGLFAVRDAETGEIVFKEVEEFAVEQDGKKFYVVTADGEYILDIHDRPIEVPANDGDYYRVNWDSARDSIGVFAFADPSDLTTGDRTRYEGVGTADQNIVKNVDGSNITLGNADGFFAVQGADGTIRYTRNTSFDVLMGEDGNWYLATGQGEYVLGFNNQRILVANGDQFTPNVDWDELREMVGVFEFPNPYGIEAWGTNRYVQTGRSGEAVACRVMGENGDWIYTMDKLQGTLIVSNVDLATQMVKLIETQRAYQISSRVVTTSDELARIANNIR